MVKLYLQIVSARLSCFIPKSSAQKLDMSRLVCGDLLEASPSKFGKSRIQERLLIESSQRLLVKSVLEMFESQCKVQNGRI